MPLPSWETLWSSTNNTSFTAGDWLSWSSRPWKPRTRQTLKTNILRAQLAGSRQEIEWAHQQKEWLEDQLQVIGSREEKAQKELQTSRERRPS